MKRMRKWDKMQICLLFMGIFFVLTFVALPITGCVGMVLSFGSYLYFDNFDTGIIR